MRSTPIPPHFHHFVLYPFLKDPAIPAEGTFHCGILLHRSANGRLPRRSARSANMVKRREDASRVADRHFAITGGAKTHAKTAIRDFLWRHSQASLISTPTPSFSFIFLNKHANTQSHTHTRKNNTTTGSCPMPPKPPPTPSARGVEFFIVGGGFPPPTLPMRLRTPPPPRAAHACGTSARLVRPRRDCSPMRRVHALPLLCQRRLQVSCSCRAHHVLFLPLFLSLAAILMPDTCT